MSPPTALLVGYNGANNTGAEALLQADIADLRAVLGPDARLTVPTLNAANLRRYLQPGPTLRIAPIPTIFFAAVRRLVREHDLVVLVEGSAYMDTWTPALLWYFLWATRCADEAGKPSLAYAVDAGQLSRLDRWLTRRVASRSELIVTRAEAAAERLRSLGVTAPITATADNAFNFRPDPGDAAWLAACWPEGARAVGLALVDFSRFPVVVRPWGHREDRYRWPYYFAHSPARRRMSRALAEGYAALADGIVARHGRPVALIGMEELDEPLSHAVQDRMQHGTWARVFSSREHDASQMTTLLRSLDLLITSRYHAAVLSMAAAVPQLAVGHDLRLLSLYQELGLADELFVKGGASPEVFTAVEERVERLLADPAPVRAALRDGYQVHAAAARRNRALLRAFARDHGWDGESAWAA
ncbi:MAG TPA: polysaccharide pyruvyl transferase family protein [Actinomycetota bacterium]|nr:polysaccharide pyruvyl transferase family protein [Actinomycetota bacterium]